MHFQHKPRIIVIQADSAHKERSWLIKVRIFLAGIYKEMLNNFVGRSVLCVPILMMYPCLWKYVHETAEPQHFLTH